MDGWQAVCAILVGAATACFLAFTGHETIAAAIGGSIVTGVFSLLTQLKHKPNGNGSNGQ